MTFFSGYTKVFVTQKFSCHIKLSGSMEKLWGKNGGSFKDELDFKRDLGLFKSVFL